MLGLTPAASATLRVLTCPHPSSIIKDTVVVPGGEATAWKAASRYVAGRNRSDALRVAASLLDQGHGASVDLFDDRVTEPAKADQAVDEYIHLVTALPAPSDVWLSLDLSHLALGTDATAVASLLERIATALPAGCRIQIGAEEAAVTDAVIECVVKVARRGLADRLGATVQANLLRSAKDANTLTDAGIHIRLVKGAYVEPVGAHPYGEATDVAYLRLGFQLAAAGANWSMATHDARLREALLLAHGAVPVEQLLGVRPTVLNDLQRRDVPTRVYVPYGDDWFRYWARRVAESRGA